MSRGHSRSRRWTTAFLALFVLVAGMRTSFLLYQCRHDGVVRMACCCDESDATASDEASQTTIANPQQCCDIRTVSPEAGVAAIAQDRIAIHSVAIWVLSIALPFHFVAPPTAALSSARLGERPLRSPPLIVLKQSFLI